jgi:hypothetical protein
LTGSSGRVDTITANRERWLATTTDDELDLQPVGRAQILCSSVLILVATLVGHLIPLVAFVWLPRVVGAGGGDRAQRLGPVRGRVYSALRVGTGAGSSHHT